MKRAEQIELLTNFCNAVRDHLVAQAQRWPEEWDGHELRSLAADAFTHEVTRVMRQKRTKRYRDFLNVVLVRNLT